MISNDDENKNANNSKKQKDFNRIFFAVERIMQKAFKDLTMHNLKPGNVYTYGFNIQIKDDGTPHIKKVEDYKSKKSHPLMRFDDSNDSNPVFDCIEHADSVTVTTEIFGVDKEDIRISIHGKQLVIDIDQDNWRCKESIELPCAVNPQMIKYTFNNGILDIIMKKKYLF